MNPRFSEVKKLKSVDQRDITALLGELHDDYRETINEFSNRHSESILNFCQLITISHEKLKLLDKSSENERIKLVGRFIFLAIDNVFLSVKFLSLGYFSQSGNSMRQSLESVCMAILISHEGEIEIGKGKNINFFDAYIKNYRNTRAHNSIRYVQRNIDILGIQAEAVDIMLAGKEHYNNYSHPNMLTFAARMINVDGGPFVVGGGYDSDKISTYELELKDRIQFTKTLPDFICSILKNVNNN